MDTSDKFDRLIQEGIIESTQTEEQLTFTESFLDELETTQRDVSKVSVEELRDRFKGDVTSKQLDESLLNAALRTPVITAYIQSLHAFLNHPINAEWIQTLPALEMLRGEVPPSSGAPDMFLPMQGDDLSSFAPLFDCGIAYIWREDCDPCDLMKESLATALEDGSNNLALFAVYGPGSPEVLWDEYNISGAPTTLFLLRGEVDARLVGDHDPDIVKSEVELLQERAQS